MRNVHERLIRGDLAAAEAALESLGTEDDHLWPTEKWFPIHFTQGLTVGSDGRHSDIRYTVVEHEPGRRVVFAFNPGIGIIGTHSFEVEPAGPGHVIARHRIDGRLDGSMHLMWPLIVRWIHDAVVEDALDLAQTFIEGSPPTAPARWSPWVRLLRKVGPKDPAPAR